MSNNKTLMGEFDLHSPLKDLGMKFAERPVYRVLFELDEVVVERLTQRYADRLYRSSRVVHDGALHWLSVVLRFDDETFVLLLANHLMRGEVCASTADRAEAVYRELEPILKEVASAVQPAFHMLRHDGCDISTEEVTDLPELVSNDMMPLFYGSDILGWIDEFNARTRGKVGGITLLEGTPGTGKTTLISQMVIRLAESHMFYVLPEGNEGALTSPELVPFWVGQNKAFPDKIKVIVMEDAERLLVRRGPHNQSEIAAMLNIADGLIGRMLRLHLVCSMNGKLEEIDPAILRPGRLYCHRHFGPIPRDLALAIAAARGVPFGPCSADRDVFTLAEILSPPVTCPRKRSGRMGF